ncbi:TPA: hypothetical protein ACLNUV_003673, partial [Vibrio cholerae O1]
KRKPPASQKQKRPRRKPRPKPKRNQSLSKIGNPVTKKPMNFHRLFYLVRATRTKLSARFC